MTNLRLLSALSGLALTLLMGSPAAQEPSAPALTERLLRQQLQQAEQKGDHLAATDLYRRLRHLAPADTTLVRGLTQVLQTSGRHDEIAPLLKDWLQDHPDDTRAYIDLGQAQQGRGQHQRAEALWTQALDQAQGRQWVYRAVSRAQQQTGRPAVAIATLETGRQQLKRDLLFAWELAELHLQSQTIDRAVDEYLKALQTTPGRLAAVESRLLPLARHTATSATLIQALQRGLTAADAPRQTALLLASCALESGDHDQTYQVLADLADRPDAAREIFQFAARCYQAGYHQTAARLYALFAANGPPSPMHHQALLRQAQIQAESGDHATAATVYTQLAQQYPQRPEAVEALYRLGRLQLENLHQPAQARRSLEAVLASAPKSLWAHQAAFLLAECDLRLDQLPRGIERLRALRNQQPSILFLLAELHYFSADFAQATAQFEQFLATAPYDDLTNDALETLLLLDTYKNHPEALTTLVQAQLEIRQQYPDKAATRLQTLATQAPLPDLQALALLSLARLRRDQGQSDRALYLLVQLTESHPESPYTLEAHLARAQLYEHGGDLALALQSYETALLRFADDVQTPQIRLHIQRLRQLRQEG